MGYHFEIDGSPAVVHPEYGEAGIDLRIDGVDYQAVLLPGSQPGEAILELDGERERIWIASKGDVHFIHLRGRAHRVVAINALERAQAEAAPSGGAEILFAPMPGVVVRVAVEAGAEVARGDLLMTIESMKLETAISAPHAAIVAEVCVSEGSSFDQNAKLIRLAATEERADVATGESSV